MEKLLEILKDSVKIKVSIKPIVHRAIDEVLEPALDKIVADSSNPFDDMIKSAIYPSLEKEIKERLDVELEKLKEKLPESVKPFIEIE